MSLRIALVALLASVALVSVAPGAGAAPEPIVVCPYLGTNQVGACAELVAGDGGVRYTLLSGVGDASGVRVGSGGGSSASGASGACAFIVTDAGGEFGLLVVAGATETGGEVGPYASVATGVERPSCLP